MGSTPDTALGSGLGYPPEWPEIARETREAAGYRCVRCNHPSARWSPPGTRHDLAAQLVQGLASSVVTIQHVEGGGAWLMCPRLPCDDRCTHDGPSEHRVLTVHHLDGDKSNLRWWNLAALCQRCHLTVQGKVRMEQAYMHEHSPWMYPYVAGFYAFVVLGIDATREEVAGRLAEFLAAGQPHLANHYRSIIP